MYFNSNFAKTASNFYGPKIVNSLLMQKQADGPLVDGPLGTLRDGLYVSTPEDKETPEFIQSLRGHENAMKGKGFSDLAKGTMIGGVAGIPAGLLAQAIFGKDKSLRGYLRAALLGSLGGAGLGAGVGASLPMIKSYLDSRERANNAKAVNEALETAYPAAAKQIAALGKTQPQFSTLEDRP